MKILSSFTHPCVVPNLYDFSSSVEHKEDILKNINQRMLVPIDFHCMEKKRHFSKYLLLRSTKKQTHIDLEQYEEGVNDDKIIKFLGGEPAL